ncbi:DUF5654 family protein [Candidatus Parcubacteria bacterium]|nr:DUF5654 family protein [Candidatus Parcubacteria bacterium]
MNEINKEIKSRTVGYIGAALGLVAGLAWNEAITAMIEKLFPLSKDTVTVKFIYAGLVTAAVVILITQLERFVNKPSKDK